jgi:pimeloyl-ACP methyl ester carboxylesterase
VTGPQGPGPGGPAAGRGRDGQLDRDGATISYSVCAAAGGQAAGGPPPLLLTHGYGASAAMWQANLGALSTGRTVITWDICGHGRTSSPADPARYSEAGSVADMAAVLDAASSQRAVVGGLSLGGYLSLAFWLRHPDRVAALILCDTGPGFRRDEPREQWNARALARADALERRGAGALSSSPEVPGTGQNLRGLALAARGILTQRDARVLESLPGITVPVLVVVGADDTPFRAAAGYLASKIPGATLAVLDGAGHAANMDQPAAFNAAVLGFLSALPPSASG